jgi:hypothetical protein
LTNRARETNLDSLDGLVAGEPGRRASGVRERAEWSPPSDSASSNDPQRRLLISIGSPADPALLEPTYAYLSAYCFACLQPQLVERLNVAIYELYANALRYGSSAGEVRLEIEHSPSGSGVILRVTNHAEPAQLERVQAQISRVQVDPSAAFSTEMNRFAGASQTPPMLGIVRVAHECALALELQIDGQRVAISVVCDG